MHVSAPQLIRAAPSSQGPAAPVTGCIPLPPLQTEPQPAQTQRSGELVRESHSPLRPQPQAHGCGRRKELPAW